MSYDGIALITGFQNENKNNYASGLPYIHVLEIYLKVVFILCCRTTRVLSVRDFQRQLPVRVGAGRHGHGAVRARGAGTLRAPELRFHRLLQGRARLHGYVMLRPPRVQGGRAGRAAT